MSGSSFEAVRWTHDDEDMPDLIAVELDSERYEVRKVEVFRDGRMQGVDRRHDAIGTAVLAEKPWPAPALIVEDPGECFSFQFMLAAEFELLWQQSQKALTTSISVPTKE